MPSPYVLTDSRVLIPCRTRPCASNCCTDSQNTITGAHKTQPNHESGNCRKARRSDAKKRGGAGAYVERAVPLSDVKVEEAMQVVDAHGLVLVHLRRPRDCRAGGEQPTAPERSKARGGEKACAAAPLRLREGGGGEAEAHESFRHAELSG